MKYIDFFSVFKTPIFTKQDLKIAGIDLSPVQLSQWTKNQYLIKLKNGVYIFAGRKDQLSPEIISRFLYEPSYVSLERALARHNLIPEIVYNCTAITTKKTMTSENDFGVFIFRSIKKDLFFGYNKIIENNNAYFLAEPEKALLDYLYLNSYKINQQTDIDELRLNELSLKKLDKKKIKEYLEIFNSKKLKRLIAQIIN